MAAAQVRLEPLEPVAFAPFGDVIRAGRGDGRDTNLGTAVRFDWAAALESTRAHARPNLAVFRSVPQVLPFRVAVLERHPASTQVFAPLRARRWLAIVAPDAPDGRPDVAGLRAFACGPHEGLNFRRGVWHHPTIVLDEPAELLMLAWEDGSGEDCEVLSLPHPVDVIG